MESNFRKDVANEALVLAHCLLNQATRWRQDGEAPKDRGSVKEGLKILSTRKLGALQLPCPEFTFCGNPRPPRTRNEYEKLPGFRLHCERLAKTSAENVKALTVMGKRGGIRILAVLGVERSPTCGVRCIPHRVGGKAENVEGRGLFFEILEKELEALGLKIPFVEIDLHRPMKSCERLKEILEGKT